uniref:Uncharacterized protein n=1 Tax=Podoviridae sp. ctW0z17 TaxID=2825254 RepID=A0A8S5UXR9_9CAUD|nr:MAG TPA: hypothetical protein [Podoviridae sp. ctW0z17]
MNHIFDSAVRSREMALKNTKVRPKLRPLLTY